MNSKTENIEKLNNRNYFNWKYRMELLLIKEDLWEVIEKGQQSQSIHRTSG